MIVITKGKQNAECKVNKGGGHVFRMKTMNYFFLLFTLASLLSVLVESARPTVTITISSTQTWTVTETILVETVTTISVTVFDVVTLAAKHGKAALSPPPYYLPGAILNKLPTDATCAYIETIYPKATTTTTTTSQTIPSLAPQAPSEQSSLETFIISSAAAPMAPKAPAILQSGRSSSSTPLTHQETTISIDDSATVTSTLDSIEMAIPKAPLTQITLTELVTDTEIPLATSVDSSVTKTVVSAPAKSLVTTPIMEGKLNPIDEKTSVELSTIIESLGVSIPSVVTQQSSTDKGKVLSTNLTPTESIATQKMSVEEALTITTATLTLISDSKSTTSVLAKSIPPSSSTLVNVIHPNPGLFTFPAAAPAASVTQSVIVSTPSSSAMISAASTLSSVSKQVDSITLITYSTV